MKNFKEQQLDMMRSLGDVFHFSYNLQVVNALAKEKPKTLVQSAEKFFRWQIEEVCENIKKRKAKVVLVSGPSSSGKTTSSLEIQKQLEKMKIKARVISMDDFFIDKDKAPKLPDGSCDFENVEKIDIPCFKKFLRDVLNNTTAKMPIYDFITDKRLKFVDVKLNKNEILIIEGIHALNPIFRKNLKSNKLYKIYVMVASNFTLGDKVVADEKQIRLMRRLLRDYYNRGRTLTEIFSMWKNVRMGEIKNIYPYRPEADYLLNTTHLFEPLLYDTLLMPIIKNSELEEVESLKKVFSYTGNIDAKYIPKTSLIREFLPRK